MLPVASQLSLGTLAAFNRVCQTSKSLIAGIDTNSDKSISSSEAPSDFADILSSIDTDSDGAANSKELTDAYLGKYPDSPASGYASNMASSQSASTASTADSGSYTDSQQASQQAASASAYRAMAPGVPPISEMIAKKDTDSDGALSSGELGLDSSVFSRVDSDGDGKATGQELAGALGVKNGAASMISQKDTDKDGGLSSSELGIDSAVFSTIDTNGDGVASQGELIDAYNARQADMKNKISALDTNADGYLAADELNADSTTFNDADKNGDGKIDNAEFGISFKTLEQYTSTAYSESSKGSTVSATA
ncbi:MAG: hypothetical protein HZB29_07715 [Nitrospinae bacterium]|nr:hypothetical protein [Nitrospinota bacterium]